MRQAFAPITSSNARTLILGSMPGVASLDAHQYYAHPRNAFWQIMQHITGIAATAAYEHRCRGLLQQQLALWDVLQACERQGSLDSNINQSRLIVNDFAHFFHQHPHIKRVLLNGHMAHQLFTRHVINTNQMPSSIEAIACPSTSPANARMPIAQKIDIWLNILN